jgi:catechol 2,3-dioxygenase-like lactoylglutathione lyase family enzyme
VILSRGTALLCIASAVMVLSLGCRTAIGGILGYRDINPMQLQGEYVILSVANMDKEVTWYERMLGFREIERHVGPHSKEVKLSTGDAYDIELVWRKGSVRPKETGYLRQGWMHVVFTTRAIDAAYERLKKLRSGVYANYNDQGHIWRIYLHDPDGNEIEIVARSGETLGALNAPPPVLVVLPAGTNRALVVRTCTACHSAQTITVMRRTKADWKRTIARMVVIGAVATKNEQELILHYLSQNFGRSPFSVQGPSGCCSVSKATVRQTLGSTQINPMQLYYDHITISVAHMHKEVAWYDRVFGLRPDVFHPGTDIEVIHLSMDCCGVHHLDLVWQKGSVRPKEAGFLGQGWVRGVFMTPVIDAAYERLKGLGVDAYASYNDKGHISGVYLHDPEGNEIEIAPRSSETPGVLGAPPPIPESVLPAGRNRALVIFTCTACHSAETFAVARRTKAGWQRTIARMVVNGAVATKGEQRLILYYLNKNFGQPSHLN